MGIKLKNNVVGYLNSTISASDTSFVLQSGNGANFPSLGASDYFYATLVNLGGVTEIVKVTARVGDSFTVARAQEGTTAQSFAAGSRVEMRITAQSVYDAVNDVAAVDVGFTPYLNIAATNVQAALQEEVDDLLAGGGSNLIGYTQGSTNAQVQTVQRKLRERISALDFIPPGTDTASVDCTTYIQNALNYVYAAGGGEVFLPAGVYRTTAPMIVRSNVHFVGSGPGTVLKRTGTGGSPFGNAIHIGYGYEYSYDRQYFAPAFDDDATIAQLLANDLSKLTTRNAKVSNIYVKDETAGKGLGIWTLNARDCVIDSMWFENTKTPVNIANDAGGWQGASYNISVSNIFQVSVDNGNDSWYDIAFTGAAVNVTFDNCFNNPNTPSYLDGMFACNGTHNLVINGCTLAGTNSSGKIGILYLGSDVNTSYDAVFSNNIIKKINNGIVIFQCSSVSVTGNYLYACDIGLRLFAKRCLVDGNFFRNNVTADMSGNGDSTFHTITNNKGLTTIVNPNLAIWEEYNKFSGNTDLTGNPYIAANGNSYGVLGARALVWHAIEANFTSTDRAKTGFSQNAGTILVNAGETVTAYYKLETFVKRVRQASVTLYADGAGDVVTIKLVGNIGAINSGGFATTTTLATGTSAGAGDWGVGTGAISQYLYNNGGYFIAVEYTPANNNSQLRTASALLMCDA